MTKDTLKQNWPQARTQAQKRWDKLSDNDLSKINGDQQQLTKVLQQRYGYDQQRAEKECRSFCDGLEGGSSGKSAGKPEGKAQGKSAGQG